MKNWIARLKKTYRLLPPLLLRDLKERYAGSTLGGLWMFLHPILLMLVFWLVFSQIIKVRITIDTGEISYLPYLLSGLLPWFALNEGIMRGASSIVEKGFIIKKVFYPSELFPISATLSALTLHGTGFLLFLIVFFLYQGGVSIAQITALCLLIAVQLVITIGSAFILAALSVYLRDILQILGLALQVIMYLTTVFYPISAVPKGLRPVFDLNPLTVLIEGYHSAILYGKFPEPASIAFLAVFSGIIMVLGIGIFRRLKKGFADVL